MPKMRLIACSMLFLAAQQGHAASIYTFSGHINSLQGWYGTPATTYAANGIYVGAPVEMQVLLDDTRPGYTSQYSVKTYEPEHKTWFDIMPQERWTRYAAWVSSNIDFAASTANYRSFNEYHDQTEISSWDGRFTGNIALGASLFIGKGAEIGDTSAFVENWQVGDTLDLQYYYGTSAVMVSGGGSLTLTAISAPLGAITPYPTPVPVPGAGMLFMSGLTAIGGFRKMRRAA